MAKGGESLTGGEHNTANGAQSSVTGGEHNTANGSTSTVTGGTGNSITSTGEWGSIAGGEINTVDDVLGFVGGGCSNTIGGGTAVSCFANGTPPGGNSIGANAILGGDGGYAGVSDGSAGFAGAVVGGQFDSVTGTSNSVLGGDLQLGGL